MKSNISSQQFRGSESKKRRRVMWLRTIKYGISNFVRNGWLSLAAIVVMSFTLLTVFVAVAATLVLNDTVEQTKIEKLDLALYLRPDTPQSIQNDIKNDIEQDSNVSFVTLYSREEASRLLEEKGIVDDETRALIEDGGETIENILPINLGIHVYDVSDIASLTELINGEDSNYKAYLDANSYEYQFFNENSQATVQNMTNIANTAQLVGFVLAAIFLLITILVIFNTIRLAIFARKDEIEMEKLIGAEKSYVRGPFLVEARIYGIISGILATLIGYLLVIVFVPAVLTGEAVGGVSMTLLHTILINFAPLIILIVILVGMLIGDVSARLAVRKYLHY